MKKVKYILLSFMFILLSVFLIGCSNNDDKLIKLEEAIKALDEKIEDDQYTISEYEEELAKLKEELEKVKKSNSITSSRADNNIEKINEAIKEINKQIETIQEISGTSISVMLADKYYLVVGDNFQLFYRSVIKAVDPYGYYIKLSGDNGHAYNRYYEFKPTTTGTYKLTIEVRDDNGHIFGSDSTVLIVTNKPQKAERKVLCIGDSLTASGEWVAEGVRKYKEQGGLISTVGTVKKTINSETVNYEGRGGWQWNNYLSGYDATPSPFKSVNGGIDFKEYMEKNNIDEITEVYIMMTFNGLPGTFQEFSFNDSFIKDAKKLIDKIHTDLPNAKISIMSLPLTSTKAGLGAYYTIKQAYGDNYGKAVTILNYDAFLEDWCKMDEYKDFMRFVDIKGQFDSENNMPSEKKAVNNTNNNVQEEVGNAMGMHPSSAGYKQIGEAFYRALMSNW